MSDRSGIEWTDATWPVVTGCEYISPGCANCYAVRDARRLSSNPNPRIRAAYSDLVERQGHTLRWTGNVQLLPERLKWPLNWRKSRKVFVCNQSDLFHEGVPDDFLDQVFATMALCPQHQFQVLTKRAERMRDYLLRATECDDVTVAKFEITGETWDFLHSPRVEWPLPNVWLGVSVENQRFADERIPLLLQTPAAVRFISAEPLLGMVDLNGLPDPKGDPSWDASALYGVRECAFGATVQREPIGKLDWVIVGGESGSGARPVNLAWVRSLVEQCRAASVPVFVKQLGEFPVMDESAWLEGPTRRWLNARRAHRRPPGTVPLKLYARKGGDPDEWPEDLRVRQFPQVRP